MSTEQAPPPLDSAPDEIKLAVDLIYLFESNEIDPKVALKAIKIVENDLQAKLAPST
ncbi:pleiotropic regulatory protein RsmS [Vibrio pelagius]|uniref:Pleiotropic regulatory protein RsmS n=1 Tax=Vibrio pelagius TaxID=28169 RepID=A0ABY5G5X9_VIBPE|nr:pleiotropic regulatory protein RsmS [Vibrio pelagius]UTT85094.1 pleiotropic regulatory protein RsmS [Vibrio pelagius]